jgi:hypothetical protein
MIPASRVMGGAGEIPQISGCGNGCFFFYSKKLLTLDWVRDINYYKLPNNQQKNQTNT